MWIEDLKMELDWRVSELVDLLTRLSSASERVRLVIQQTYPPGGDREAALRAGESLYHHALIEAYRPLLKLAQLNYGEVSHSAQGV
jgi:hypothetical protein